MSERLKKANAIIGTSQFVIAAKIKRDTIFAIIIAAAIATFTGQALSATRAGTFALTNNWFSLSFISLIYVPLLVRTTGLILDFRDRKLLEES